MRVTVAIALSLLLLALPLVVVSGVLSVAVIGKLPDSRGDFFPLSVVLTFALFFAVMAWRSFASIGRTGPALLKRSDGGMIAPLCSPAVYEQVINGGASFALTPEHGYW
jgi:hypothetical protein